MTNSIVSISIFVSLIVIFGALSLLFFFKEKKWENIKDDANIFSGSEDDKKLYRKAWSMAGGYQVAKWITICILCFVFIFGIFLIPISIENLILWSNAPEMAMFKSLL